MMKFKAYVGLSNKEFEAEAMLGENITDYYLCLDDLYNDLGDGHPYTEIEIDIKTDTELYGN